MCGILTVNLFRFLNQLTCFNEYILLILFMKVQQNLPIKKLLGKTPPVLVTAGKRQQKPPRHRLTPQWVRALASAEKDVQITRQQHQKLVLSTAPLIIMMNARSQDTLVLIKLNVSLLSTGGIIPYQEINLTGSRKIILLLIMRWMKFYYTKHKKQMP